MRRLLSVIVGFMSICVFSSILWGADLRFKGVGAHIGLVDPEDIKSTVGFGVHSDLGTLAPNLRLEASIDYWRKSYKRWGAEMKTSDLFLLGMAKYLFAQQNSPVTPYAGGGIGFHRFSSSNSHEDSRFDVDVHGVGGVEYSFIPQMTAFVDFRFTFADIDHLGLYGGLTFYFPVYGE